LDPARSAAGITPIKLVYNYWRRFRQVEHPANFFKERCIRGETAVNQNLEFAAFRVEFHPA
jgi:hypothetical protein